MKKELFRAITFFVLVILISNIIFNNIFSVIFLLKENPILTLFYEIIIIGTAIYILILELKGKKLELKRLIMN